MVGTWDLENPLISFILAGAYWIRKWQLDYHMTSRQINKLAMAFSGKACRFCWMGNVLHTFSQPESR